MMGEWVHLRRNTNTDDVGSLISPLLPSATPPRQQRLMGPWSCDMKLAALPIISIHLNWHETLSKLCIVIVDRRRHI